jgi:hypothetical protein
LTTFQLDWSKLLKVQIDGAEFAVFMPVTNYSTVVIDREGTTFLYYHLPELKPLPHPTGSMWCQQYCGHQLKRFHASCFTCQARLVWAGKLPKLVKLKQMYTLFISARQSRVKALLQKRFLTFSEMTC